MINVNFFYEENCECEAGGEGRFNIGKKKDTLIAIKKIENYKRIKNQF